MRLLTLVLVSFLAEPRGGEYTIRFGEHLRLSEGVRLEASPGFAAIRFTCETARKPVRGSRLHLFIEHSPELDGTRSFLSVTLNHGILRSLRLDRHNQGRTEVVIPIPPEMLQSENELLFSILQYRAGSGPVWTAIHPDSFIAVRYEETDPALDLRQLPAPLLDVYSYRSKEISVLLPRKPAMATLESAALVVANLASAVAPAPLTVRTVRSMDAATTPLVIVGTP